MPRAVWCLFQEGRISDIFRTLEAAKDAHTEAPAWTRRASGYYTADDGWTIERYEVVG